MEGRVTLSVLTEHHEGPIGEDWRYWIRAKVFNLGLKGKATINVAKHTFPAGVTQEPPSPPDPVEIPAGDPDNEIKVNLTLEATEVDLFKNDVGITDTEMCLHFPKAGEEPEAYEKELSVGVVESPGLIGETSIFTVKVRLVLSRG